MIKDDLVITARSGYRKPDRLRSSQGTSSIVDRGA